MILKNYRKRERNLTTLNHFCKNEDAEKIGEGAKSEARTASMKGGGGVGEKTNKANHIELDLQEFGR